jgi:Secretion system C-terminal sorting domain
MKNNIISKIALFIFLIAFCNIKTLFAQDPAVTGAAFAQDPLQEGATTTLTISFANASSNSIPTTTSVQVTVSFPNNWYNTDGVTPPTGGGAAYFNWVFLGANTWRGTNNATIPGFGGGAIVFTVEGLNETNGNAETTNINISTTAGNFANDNLAPALEISAAPLPVALISFNAHLDGENGVLDWKTASEENNDYFSIERSANGKDFEAVGKVRGNGTSSQINAYSFVDKKATAYGDGVLYYRLKQVDFDGTFSYSDIDDISWDKRSSFSVYPNPTPGTLFFSNTDDIVNITIYDEAGKVLLTGNTEELLSGRGIDISSFKEGILLISIEKKRGELTNEKIILIKPN